MAIDNTDLVVLDTGEIVEANPHNLENSKERFDNELVMASHVAKNLSEIIDEQKDRWAVALRPKDKNAPVYLGRAYEYRAILDGIVERDIEEPNAWIARVKIVDKFDRQVGAGDSICGTADEPYWAKQPTYAKKSMAQTRAISKAYRSCLAWVAVLAGFEPTPYEEMQGVTSQQENDKNDPLPDYPQKPISEPQKNLIHSLADNDESTKLVTDYLEQIGVIPSDVDGKRHLADMSMRDASTLITNLKEFKGIGEGQ